MEKKEQVKELWHLVYDLMRGPGSNKRFLGSSFVQLSNTYDEELLAEIAILQTKQGSELSDSIAAVRAKAGLAQSFDLFAASDLERINVLLDKIV